MKLIVGLGNPGEKYARTRHNVGFVVIDALQDKLGLGDFQDQAKFSGWLAQGDYQDERIFLLKPGTFMNLSGEAVAKTAHYYKIPLCDVWLVFDDVDLPLGEVRFREKGSAGTHNGMRSVVASLGSEDFPRFRLGIESRGVHAPDQQDVHSFVLQDFLPAEQEIFRHVVEDCVDLIRQKL